MTKLNRIKRALDRLENGGYSEFTIGQCTDYIGWLAKYHKLPKTEIDELAEQAIRILKTI